MLDQLNSYRTDVYTSSGRRLAASLLAAALDFIVDRGRSVFAVLSVSRLVVPRKDLLRSIEYEDQVSGIGPDGIELVAGVDDHDIDGPCPAISVKYPRAIGIDRVRPKVRQTNYRAVI